MSLNLYLAFVAACIALALLPGPVVTLLIANGLRHGTRAALINVAGAQTGLAIVIGIVAVGLTSLMATMGYWFDWVRFAGAAYLVWLGIKLIRAPVEGVSAEAPPPPPRGGFFLQGFVVLLSNPKVLVFFGAFIPQFMDMSKDHVSQVALLGVTFMITGAITDSIYAILAGRARKFFSARRRRLAGTDAGAVKRLAATPAAARAMSFRSRQRSAPADPPIAAGRPDRRSGPGEFRCPCSSTRAPRRGLVSR